MTLPDLPLLAAATRPLLCRVASEGGDVPIAELELASGPTDIDSEDGGDKPVGGDSIAQRRDCQLYG